MIEVYKWIREIEDGFSVYFFFKNGEWDFNVRFISGKFIKETKPPFFLVGLKGIERPIGDSYKLITDTNEIETIKAEIL